MSRADKLTFASPQAQRCFNALLKATDGFASREIAEAAGTLLAIAICESSSSREEAGERATRLGAAIVLDVEASWPVHARPRKEGLQ